MQYLVMECHVAYAVVLDEQGGFHKVVNKGYEVGQRVNEVIAFDMPISEVTGEKSKKKINRTIVFRMAATAACICFVFLGVMQNYVLVYGKVHMQINPEVMVSVNRRQQVIAIEALNEDGETLLEDYSYRMKHIDVVFDELTTKAEEMGYLEEEAEIRIELISSNKEWQQETRELVTAKADEKYKEEVVVTIEEVEPSVEENQPEEIIPEDVTPEDNFREESPQKEPSSQQRPEGDSGEMRPEQRPEDGSEKPALQQRPEENNGEQIPGQKPEENTEHPKMEQRPEEKQSMNPKNPVERTEDDTSNQEQPERREEIEDPDKNFGDSNPGFRK